MDLFKEAVNDLHFRDLGFVGYKFTWSNKGKNYSVILKRLDRFLGNDAFFL